MGNNTDITMSQYRELSRLVYTASGIYLPESKLGLLKARIAKRLRILRIDTANEYISLVRQDAHEFRNFIDAITTNHTFFFRENGHFEFILKHIDKSRHLNIWSAACSTGEEPYSLAVQLVDNAYDFHLYASDISDSVLKIAKTGIYPKERAQRVPLPILRKYFQQGRNEWKDYVKVRGEVKKFTTFGKHNLLSDSSRQQFDIIFCRNVMIYFDNETRQKVVLNLCRALRAKGYLFVGMSESLRGIEHGLKHVSPGVYRS
ncbi:MAG: chemotaxis protein CheR [Deltaproteobacteria bacterium]|nr:chemotaxis protein CheR [Deltaproteobacteria bacterium]